MDVALSNNDCENHKKAKPDIIVPDEKYTPPPALLPKGLNLSLIKPPPAANLQEI